MTGTGKRALLQLFCLFGFVFETGFYSVAQVASGSPASCDFPGSASHMLESQAGANILGPNSV